LVDLLVHHREKLRRLSPDAEQTRTLQFFMEGRRKFVNDKTRYSNRLTAYLKIYFPQALDWFFEVTSQIAGDFLEGMTRVLLLGDPSKDLGAIAEPECRRILAAIDLAEARRLPVEWVALSSGARIALESGTENLAWTAAVLARLIRFTADGGVINVIVDGPCVGAQSYWNAEATMLMHCKGALVMTPRGYMILTGKRALEQSGSVAGATNEAIGT